MPRRNGRNSSSSSSSSNGNKRNRGQHGQGHGHGHGQGHGGFGQPMVVPQHYQQPYSQPYGQPGSQYSGYGNNDQVLQQKIELIFQKYDRDGTGQLDEREFSACFGELCQMLNMPPPSDYNQFANIARQIDTNYDGRISRQELFAIFKRYSGY